MFYKRKHIINLIFLSVKINLIVLWTILEQNSKYNLI